MENTYVLFEEIEKENLAVTELEGRVYFETLPLLTVTDLFTWPHEPPPPPAVTGIRG